MEVRLKSWPRRISSHLQKGLFVPCSPNCAWCESPYQGLWQQTPLLRQTSHVSSAHIEPKGLSLGSPLIYGDGRVYTAFWHLLVMEAKPPTDIGGYMKPGKNISSTSFRVDECLLQTHCCLGLGVVSEVVLLDLLGFVTLLSVHQT